MQAYLDVQQARSLIGANTSNSSSATVPARDQLGFYNASYSPKSGFKIQGTNGAKVFKSIETAAVRYVSAHSLCDLRKRCRG
jgi:hypothetical protein